MNQVTRPREDLVEINAHSRPSDTRRFLGVPSGRHVTRVEVGGRHLWFVETDGEMQLRAEYLARSCASIEWHSDPRHPSTCAEAARRHCGRCPCEDAWRCHLHDGAP